MNMIRHVCIAQETVVTTPKIFSRLVQVLLASIGQMTPSVWEEGLVDVGIEGVRISWSPGAMAE